MKLHFRFLNIIYLILINYFDNNIVNTQRGGFYARSFGRFINGCGCGMRAGVRRNNGNNDGGNEGSIYEKPNFPPGYQESVLAIAAFCIKNQNCVSLDEQDSLYECMVDESGDTTESMQTFQKCTSKNTDGCDNKSLQELQTCIAKIGKNNKVSVPTETTVCIRKKLSVDNLDCMRKKYPSLKNLFPLKPGPSAKKSANKAAKPKNPQGWKVFQG